MTEMIGHIAETAGHDEPKRTSVTMDRNPRSRCRNHRSRWAEIRNLGSCSSQNSFSLASADQAACPEFALSHPLKFAEPHLTQHGTVDLVGKLAPLCAHGFKAMA
jgi:hypothetical protein